MPIKLKRIYETPTKADGVRILVDRLWPRGLSKEKAQLDNSLKEIAPSNELRKAFHHGDLTFEQLKAQYMDELKAGEKKAAFNELIEIAKDAKTVTLLFAAKNEEENQAVILKGLIDK